MLKLFYFKSLIASISQAINNGFVLLGYCCSCCIKLFLIRIIATSKIAALSHILCICFLFEADFLIGKKIQLPNFRNTLKERGTVQMLTVSREAALEVQVIFDMFFSLCTVCILFNLCHFDFKYNDSSNLST